MLCDHYDGKLITSILVTCELSRYAKKKIKLDHHQKAIYN